MLFLPHYLDYLENGYNVELFRTFTYLGKIYLLRMITPAVVVVELRGHVKLVIRLWFVLW